jgi:hypothetical protein
MNDFKKYLMSKQIEFGKLVLDKLGFIAACGLPKRTPDTHKMWGLSINHQNL